MAIMAKSGGNVVLVDEGTHQAICNMVVDLGLQETTYLGTVSHKHQVYIRWELPLERITWEEDGQEKEGPRVTGKFYTLSLGDKANLRKDLESWRGKKFTKEELDGFDVGKLLGAPCQITITHNEAKTWANVNTVAGWPKGVTKKKPECPLVLFDDDNDTYDILPEWLQKKIDARLVSHEDLVDDSDGLNPGCDLDDEIPF